YRYQGVLIFFGALKNHYAISVPPPNAVFEVFRGVLLPYKVSKSTIQFPVDLRLPLDLAGDIVRVCAKENLAKAKLKRKSPVRRRRRSEYFDRVLAPVVAGKEVSARDFYGIGTR